MPGPASSGELASRLACADSAFPRLSHEGALGVIRDLEFPAVDVCVFAGYEHNPPESVIEDPAGAADEVLARLDRFGLAVSDVFVILGTSFEELAVNHPEPAVRRESLSRFERMVEFARRLSAAGVTVLPGAGFDGVSEDEGLALAAAELQRRAEIAGAAELALAVEPHYGSIIPTPARALGLIEAAPDVSLALDLSHFVYQGIAQEEADPLLPRTRHVHLRQAAPGAMQARTAEGEIDFLRLLDGLEASGYTGYLALEYQHEDWLECNRVDCISETAELRDLILGREDEG